jgi:VIT1/CCC1 family predicted Fe2+/Mn2+ transporter
VPLAPFVFRSIDTPSLAASIVLTFVTLFGIGALRSLITIDRWWAAGLEMLLLGVAVALAAYGSGAFVAWWLLSA